MVLAAGALAAAVTAVITLVMTLAPNPDPIDRVQITAAVLTPQPLSGYAATAVLRPLPQDGGGANVVVLPRFLAEETATPKPSSTETPSQPPETSEEDLTGTTGSKSSTTSSSSATTTTTPSTTTPSTTTPSTTTPSTTTPSTTSQEPDPVEFTPDPDVSGAFAADGDTALWCDVLEQPTVVEVELQTCEELQNADVQIDGGGDVDMSPAVPAPGNALLDDEGRPASPEVAASRVAESLDGVRSTHTEGKVDPIGMRATVTLEIEGLRGRTLALYWRLSPATAGTSLPAEWVIPVPACRLVPGTDLDTASIDIWIPLPDASGPFVLDLYIATETTALTSYRTEPFA